MDALGILAAFLSGGLGGAAVYALAKGQPIPTNAEIWQTLKETSPLLTQIYTIDLTEAHNYKEFLITGTSIHVENPEVATVPVYINFNDQNTQRLDLCQYRDITAPFWRFFITNTAGAGVLTIVVNKFSAVGLYPSITNIRVSNSGIMLPVDLQAQYITLDMNMKQWGGTNVTGANLTTYIARLDVALSTLATQVTLASLLAKHDVNLSTLASQATLASVLAKLDVALSTRATEATLLTKVNKAATPVMYNIAITNADTEYSQALPASTKRFKIVLADGTSFRLAFVTGKVAAPTTPYWTQPANLPYLEQLIEPSALTLYFACAAGTKVAQIVAWS